jgi:hypothetical protein
LSCSAAQFECSPKNWGALQDGRIYIELINAAFLAAGGSPAEYRASIERAIAKGWLWRNESGTYVKFTPAGADLFA